MTGLRLSLLGPPRIEVDGKLLEVDTRMAIALLAYLAISNQPQSRDDLATLLWPEYDQANARANLRRTLSALRRGLGGRWVTGERERIHLERTPDLSVDIDEFAGALRAISAHAHPPSEVCGACIEPLTRAAELYRGPFLSGFTLRESAAFDDWQAYHAEILSRDLAGALERLTRAMAATGQFDAAIACGRRWLALDPLHEPAHRRLMLLYAWAGERTAALRQYRDCVRVLDDELAVAPLPETSELAESIRANHEPAPPTRLTPPAPAPAPAPPTLPTPTTEALPLVGRAAEWQILLSAVERPTHTGSLVVLEGEAGIGKTRLVEELLAHVRALGGRAIEIRCYEGEAHLPYAPVVEALRAVIASGDPVVHLEDVPEHALNEAARLLPELADMRAGQSPHPLDGPGAHSRFIDGVLQVMCALTRSSAPAVVVFDDAQWADEGTFDLLSHLARHVRGQDMCVVVAYRGEAVAADDRLRRLVADVRRTGAVIEVMLHRLQRQHVLELARALAPLASSAVLDDVVRQTEGLPYFVVEYLRAISSGEPAAELPGSVRELLHSRLHGTSPAAMQLLTTGAVIGRSFDFETLRRASGRSEDETVGALDELVARGLIREVGGGGPSQLQFDFAHAWLRTLVYDETSLSRRRLLHKRVAEALENHRTRAVRELGPVAGQIAMHYQQAGRESDAAEFFRIAGEYARGLYANSEAMDHFRAALALGYPSTPMLHEDIGDLQTLMGQYTAALTSYELAAALCSQTDLARVEHKLANLYGRRGEWEHAESHFRSAEAEFQDGPQAHLSERSRLYADWSLVASRRGETLRAEGLADRALQLAQAADDPNALIQAHNILGILANRRGEPEASLKHHERSLALAENVDDRPGRIAALNNLALVLGAAGEFDQAIAATTAALELCVAQGDRHREAALHNNLADLLHAVGRSEEAMVHLKRAVTIFAEIGAAADPTQPEIWKLTEW